MKKVQHNKPSKQSRPKSSSFYTTYLKKADKHSSSPSVNYYSISHTSNYSNLIQVQKSLGVKKHKFSKSQKEIKHVNSSNNPSKTNKLSKMRTTQGQNLNLIEKKGAQRIGETKVFQNEYIHKNVNSSTPKKHDHHSLSKQDIKVSLNQEREKQRFQRQKLSKQKQAQQKKLKDRQKIIQKQRKRRFLNPYQQYHQQSNSNDRISQLRQSGHHIEKVRDQQIPVKSTFKDIYATGDRCKLKNVNARSTKSKFVAYQSSKNYISLRKQETKKPRNSNYDQKSRNNNSSLSNLTKAEGTQQYLNSKHLRVKSNSAIGHYKQKQNIVNEKQKIVTNSVRNKHQSKSMYDQLEAQKEQGQANINSQTSSTVRNVKMKFSHRTKEGVQYNNPNKTNQDSLLALLNFHNYAKNTLQKSDQVVEQLHLFCVADGHGIHGHHVSQTIVENLPIILKTYLNRQNAMVHKSLFKTYQMLQEILTENRKQINIQSSGSTMVTVLIKGNTLTCANAGDSRAILGRQIDKKCWEMVYLSEDHKPSLQKQKKRILKCGGKIHPFRDQNGVYVGPYRVWLPNKNFQGLAMSRSLGDNISKPVGVTHQPQLIKVNLQERDKFMLLASDGVWEFITNQQVLQLIVPFYRQNKLEQACDALMRLAYEKWTVQDSLVVDDITFILVFFWK